LAWRGKPLLRVLGVSVVGGGLVSWGWSGKRGGGVLTVILVAVDEALAGTVTVVVVDGHSRHVDGELLKVGTAVPV
jgi:hypothetical protein